MPNFPDTLLRELDVALRTVAGPVPTAARPMPRPDPPPAADTDTAQRALTARLMRVNHAGEVAAQALYRGQAYVARNVELRRRLLLAAAEEADHLAWCATRTAELGSHTSRLAPVWYGTSFAIGVLAGLAGDRFSLGFLAETEKQVVEHLDGHLEQIPSADAATRRIVEQMQVDETAHCDTARELGGRPLPAPITAAMRGAARLMTTVAARI